MELAPDGAQLLFVPLGALPGVADDALYTGVVTPIAGLPGAFVAVFTPDPAGQSKVELERGAGTQFALTMPKDTLPLADEAEATILPAANPVGALVLWYSGSTTPPGPSVP